MSTPEDRLAAIQAIYLDAINNELADLAKAQTAKDVAAIQANVGNAKLAYFSAAAEALTNGTDKVETAYLTVKKALAKVEAARASAAAIPTLLKALNSATDAANGLLELAKRSGA